jgi:hypothetical protein
MKKINLNIWQKIGVVLSLVWLVYFPYTQISEANKQAIELTAWEYKNCLEDNIKLNQSNNCELLRADKINLLEQVNFLNIFAGTFFVLLFAWLTACIVFYLVKVIYSGFKQTIIWSKLSTGKKWFVGLCYVYSGFLILVSILLITGLYIETKVPYYLPSFSVSKDYNGYVFVTGSWKRTQYKKDDILNIQNEYKEYSIVTTGKDFVKLKEFNIENLYLMDLDIEISSNVDFTLMDEYINSFNK